jgi:hypothetical protein
MKNHIKKATVATIAVLAGCASEKGYQPQSSEKVYHTQTSAQTSNPTGLAVLVDRSARIEGRELVWSCVYQTAEGRVLVEQHQECERAMSQSLSTVNQPDGGSLQ